MKFNIIGIALGVILGVPAIALGSSFTYSLVQGQSPSEAVSTVSSQLGSLFGRVDSIEAEQQVISDRFDVIEQDTPDLDLELDKTSPLPKSGVDTQLCIELQERVNELNLNLQEKKVLLQKVKGGSSQDEADNDLSLEDWQASIKDIAAQKNSLEGNVHLLQAQVKELVTRIKEEKCI